MKPDSELRVAGRYGKLAKRNDYRTLRFSHYLMGEVPAPKPEIDNIARALTALKATEADIPTLFPMDCNQDLGCCTVAGKAHIQTLWNGFLGTKVIAPASLVKSDYFRQTDGQDSGLDLLNVLNDWHKNSFNGDQITAFAEVDPKNLDHVKLAIEMFGALYTGVQCTRAMDEQFNARLPWVAGPLIPDGHLIVTPKYTAANAFTCFTWGSTQDMELSFWNECVDGCYAILPPEAMLPGFSPFFNSSQAAADLRLVTN